MTNYDIIYEYAADNYGLITTDAAKRLAIPNVELAKLASRGRLSRIGYGVYRVAHYIPTAYDKYAEAVALVGSGAAIYGESVLAMHGLALVNPTLMYIATQGRVRRTLPAYIRTVFPKTEYSVTEYEGIPSQNVFDAIVVCKNTVMSDRLVEATREAERQGLITSVEAKTARKQLQ